MITGGVQQSGKHIPQASQTIIGDRRVGGSDIAHAHQKDPGPQRCETRCQLVRARASRGGVEHEELGTQCNNPLDGVVGSLSLADDLPLRADCGTAQLQPALAGRCSNDDANGEAHERLLAVGEAPDILVADAGCAATVKVVSHPASCDQ